MSTSYTYEPYWSDPARELKACLNFYRDLVQRLHFWDLMEFVAYLDYRDGVEWALEQLGRENVAPEVLAEIEALDAKLRANAAYLIDELELYEHIWRDEPQKFWWWYMDGGEPDGPLKVHSSSQNTPEMVWEPAEAAPLLVAAEEKSPYEVQQRDAE